MTVPSGPPYWPIGETGVADPFDDLPGHLLRASAMHGRAAISRLGCDVDELPTQAISIGACIELLVKSTLATLSFHLIADQATANNMRGFTEPRPLVDGLPDVTTLGGEASLVRLNKEANLHLNPKDYALVFRVRNTALHLGSVSRQANEAALLLAVELVDHIYKKRNELGVPRAGTTESFWGRDHAGMVTDLVAQRKQAVITEYHRKLQRAQANYRQFFESLRTAEHLALLADLRAEMSQPPPLMPGPPDYQAAPFPCPACGNQGWILYYVEREMPEQSMDPGGDERYLVQRTGWAERFQCGVCKLTLDTEKELKLADMPISVDLEDDDATSEELNRYDDYMTQQELRRQIDKDD